MEKLLKSEPGPDEWAYNKVLKLRVMERTYTQLVAMQKRFMISQKPLLTVARAGYDPATSPMHRDAPTN